MSKSFRPQPRAATSLGAGGSRALCMDEDGPDLQEQLGNAYLSAQLEAGEEGHDHALEQGEPEQDEARDPDPGGAGADLDTTRPINGDVPAEIRAQVISNLQTSPRAAELLSAIQTARGDLSFPMKWSDRGSYHSSGSIYLDRNRPPESWFGTLAHELVHLLTFVSGNAANAATMGREEFVQAKMSDEINAQAAAFVALMQVGRFEGQVGLAEFSEWLAANHPEHMVCLEDPAADAANWAEVEALARTWLESKYRNEWTTSNTGENYYDYWGAYWDANHGG